MHVVSKENHERVFMRAPVWSDPYVRKNTMVAPSRMEVRVTHFGTGRRGMRPGRKQLQ